MSNISLKSNQSDYIWSSQWLSYYKLENTRDFRVSVRFSMGKKKKHAGFNPVLLDSAM